MELLQTTNLENKHFLIKQRATRFELLFVLTADYKRSQH